MLLFDKRKDEQEGEECCGSGCSSCSSCDDVQGKDDLLKALAGLEDEEEK